MEKATRALGSLRFGTFEVDLQAGELRKRKSGLKLKLTGQPFQVLAILLERPGEVVTRDELHKRLWAADTFVDFEHGLNAAVNRLREVLGDSAESPRFVETLPRRGYRFIGVVNGAKQTVRKEKPWFRSGNAIWVVVAGALTLAWPVTWLALRWKSSSGHDSIQIRSIAVLPLENLSGDPAQDYFADGMTDELIATLAKDHSLRIVSHTSIMRFKATHLPIREVARELGVEGIVEGSVLRSGKRIRLTAQLIQASTDSHLLVGELPT